MTLVINFLTGAPRTPAPTAPDPRTSGDGRFGNLLNDLWESENQSGDFLGDASPSPDDGQQAAGKTVADVFNQHGLMAQDAKPTTSPVAPGGLATLASTNDTVAADNTKSSHSGGLMCPVTSAGPIAITVVPTENDTALPAPEIVSGTSLLLPLHSATIGPATAKPPSASAWSRSGPPSFTAKLPLQTSFRVIPIAQQLTGADEEDQAEPMQPSRPELPEASATSDAQVTLGLSVQGATIIARAVESSQPGRVKLRERVTALLARFGLRAVEVRLNGVLLARAVDPQREEF